MRTTTSFRQGDMRGVYKVVGEESGNLFKERKEVGPHNEMKEDNIKRLKARGEIRKRELLRIEMGEMMVTSGRRWEV